MEIINLADLKDPNDPQGRSRREIIDAVIKEVADFYRDKKIRGFVFKDGKWEELPEDQPFLRILNQSQSQKAGD